MKDWDNFGDNDSIDSMFEDNVCTKRTVLQEPEPQTEVLEDQEEDIQIEEGEQEILEKADDEKLTQYRSAKYSDVDIERLSKIIKAVGLKNESEALRWVLKALWDIHGEEIERVAKEVERAEKRLKKIRTL